MTQVQANAESTDAPSGSSRHVVHSFMHFLRIIRYRKGVVITCVVVSLLLGGLYYATTTRLYESRASILVMQTGSDVRTTRITPEGARQGLMPTYERILRSSEVLEGAVKRLDPSHRIDFRDVEPDKWADAVKNNLLVRTVRNSNVIDVIYRSKSPESAAAVVQAVVDEYVAFMRKTNGEAAQEILRVLIEEKDSTYQKLTEKRDETLRIRQHVLDLGLSGDGNHVHPTLKEALVLNDALVAARQLRAELQASLGAVDAAIRRGDDLKQFVLSVEGEVGRQIMMSALGFSTDHATTEARLRQQLLEDQAELEAISAGVGPQHPKHKGIAIRIQRTHEYLAGYQKHVNEKLAAMQSGQLGPMLVRLYQQKLSEAIRNEAELSLAYESAAKRASSLVGQLSYVKDLQRGKERLERVYEDLLDKIASVDLTQNHGNIRTRVTDTPKVMYTKVWPKAILVGPFSLIVGLAVGVALVSVLDVLDDRFRSPEELRVQLALPLLAIVRKLSTLAETGLDAMQMNVNPDATESEAFRTLRTAIAFSKPESGRLVVSSTEPSDGKTTVISNLAVAYARGGKRTLLIDADMRRPGLTRLLELRDQPGLTQLLQGTEPVATMAEQFFTPTGIDSLDVIPSGPRQVNPAELLVGPRLAELLAWAESRYDQILIDAPPAAAATDAAIVAAHSDGLVLVVRPEKNKRQSVVRAVEGFRSIGLEPLGLVVNAVGADSDAGYYGYAQSYEYNYGTEDDQTPGISSLDEPVIEQATAEVRQEDVAEDNNDIVDAVSIEMPAPTTPKLTTPRRAA